MKKLIIIVIVLIAGVVWFYQSSFPEVLKVDLPLAQQFEEFEEEIIKPEEIAIEEEKEVAGVKIDNVSINLDVPFTAQAPTANWEQPFQDACEEASILMVDYYYNNRQFPSKEEVTKILLDLVQWQEDNWSGHFNLPIEEVALLAKTTFGYETEVIENLTVEKIKEFL